MGWRLRGVTRRSGRHLCRVAVTELARACKEADERYVCAVLQRLLNLDHRAIRRDVTGWLRLRFPHCRPLLTAALGDRTHPGCGWTAVTGEAELLGVLIARPALWVPSRGNGGDSRLDQGDGEVPGRWSEFAVWRKGTW